MASQSFPFLQISFSQLVPSLPVLLAYLAGVVVALIFLPRYKAPCILMLIASLLFFITVVSQTLVGTMFIFLREVRGWTASHFSLVTMITSILGSFVRAVAFGLLCAAALVGRRDAR
jgi:hypothetical protein